MVGIGLVEQAALLRHRRAAARGINPPGVKDGPYGYELAADGTLLVDLPERYHVTVGGGGRPGTYLWSCDELPDAGGSITDIRQMYIDAKTVIVAARMSLSTWTLQHHIRRQTAERPRWVKRTTRRPAGL